MDQIEFIARKLAARDTEMNPKSLGGNEPPEPWDFYEDMAETAIKALSEFGRRHPVAS